MVKVGARGFLWSVERMLGGVFFGRERHRGGGGVSYRGAESEAREMMINAGGCDSQFLMVAEFPRIQDVDGVLMLCESQQVYWA